MKQILLLLVLSCNILFAQSGSESVRRYAFSKIAYPIESKECFRQGKIIVTFSKNGDEHSVRVLESFDKNCAKVVESKIQEALFASNEDIITDTLTVYFIINGGDNNFTIFHPKPSDLVIRDYMPTNNSTLMVGNMENNNVIKEVVVENDTLIWNKFNEKQVTLSIKGYDTVVDKKSNSNELYYVNKYIESDSYKLLSNEISKIVANAIGIKNKQSGFVTITFNKAGEMVRYLLTLNSKDAEQLGAIKLQKLIRDTLNISIRPLSVYNIDCDLTLIIELT